MRRISIAALFLIVTVGQTAAWGPTGHRVTGAIAELYLSPEAKIAVQQILGTESLAEASTWPDFMRSSPMLSGRAGSPNPIITSHAKSGSQRLNLTAMRTAGH